MKSGDYRDLIVCQKSVKLVGTVYKLTNQFPKKEIFGLTSDSLLSEIMKMLNKIIHNFRNYKLCTNNYKLQ
jgi:hypothetical protein